MFKQLFLIAGVMPSGHNGDPIGNDSKHHRSSFNTDSGSSVGSDVDRCSSPPSSMDVNRIKHSQR